MAPKRRKTLLFNPNEAIREFTRPYTRPNGGVIDLKYYVFPCIAGCGAEVLVRSSDLTNPKVTGRCKECFYKTLSSSARLRPFEALYNTLRHRHGISIELTYDEFLWFTTIETCHYCDATINWVPYFPSKTRRTKVRCPLNLDRKDNYLGYSRSNCVVCCWRCNLIKSDVLSYDQMLRLASRF